MSTMARKMLPLMLNVTSDDFPHLLPPEISPRTIAMGITTTGRKKQVIQFRSPSG